MGKQPFAIRSIVVVSRITAISSIVVIKHGVDAAGTRQLFDAYFCIFCEAR